LTQICAFGIWVQKCYFLKCTYLGGGNYIIGFKILFIKSYVSFKYVVINHQKGGEWKCIHPFVSFGDLDDNTFKRLTSLLSVEQEIQYDEHTWIVYNDSEQRFNTRLNNQWHNANGYYMISILVWIYGQDPRNHYIHMIKIEDEVIKRIGQAKVNKIWGIVNWLDHITISPYMLL
jgi:hypothetical protein